MTPIKAKATPLVRVGDTLVELARSQVMVTLPVIPPSKVMPFPWDPKTKTIEYILSLGETQATVGNFGGDTNYTGFWSTTQKHPFLVLQESPGRLATAYAFAKDDANKFGLFMVGVRLRLLFEYHSIEEVRAYYANR